MMRDAHARGIEYHYDLSNEFYELFLDRRFMVYMPTFDLKLATLRRLVVRKD